MNGAGVGDDRAVQPEHAKGSVHGAAGSRNRPGIAEVDVDRVDTRRLVAAAGHGDIAGVVALEVADIQSDHDRIRVGGTAGDDTGAVVGQINRPRADGTDGIEAYRIGSIVPDRAAVVDG